MKKWIFISDEAIEAEMKEDAFIELAEMINSGKELSGLFLVKDADDFQRLIGSGLAIRDGLFEEYDADIGKIYKNKPKKELKDEEIAERNKKSEEILRNLLGKGN